MERTRIFWIFWLPSVALVVVLVFALAALIAPKEGQAHPLGFESDLSEDGTVSVCNPEGIVPNRLAAGIERWNSLTAPPGGPGGSGKPSFSDVTAGGDGAFCEVRLQQAGGNGAPFYARVVFGAHPDRLQISARFRDLPPAQRQATLSHELGHAAGLDHPGDDAATCPDSVMTTYAGCLAADLARREDPGPHDRADLLAYWVEAPIYPVANKCWSSEDVDGDGVCDRFGPPASPDVPAEGPASRAAGSRQQQPQETPPVVED
jgi:hypothetical protein